MTFTECRFKLNRRVCSGFVICNGELRNWFCGGKFIFVGALRQVRMCILQDSVLLGRLATEYFLRRAGLNIARAYICVQEDFTVKSTCLTSFSAELRLKQLITFPYSYTLGKMKRNKNLNSFTSKVSLVSMTDWTKFTI